MKFYRNIIILLVVFIALGLTYIYLPKQEDKDSGGEEITIKSISKDSMAEISLKNHNGLITLVRNGTDWNMIKPREYKLDKVSTESFVDNFTDLKSQGIVEENTQELKNYGLDNPEATLTVKTTDGKSISYLLGNETPIEGERYLKTSDSNTVYRVNSYIAGDLLRSSFEFRDKAVYQFKPEEVNTVVLTKQGKEFIRFVKENEWSVVAAEGKSKGKQDEISSVVDKFSGLKIKESIVDDPEADLKKYGLDNPDYTVLMLMKDGTKQELHVGKEKDDESLYVKKPGQTEVFTVSKEDISFIYKNTKDFIKN